MIIILLISSFTPLYWFVLISVLSILWVTRFVCIFFFINVFRGILNLYINYWFVNYNIYFVISIICYHYIVNLFTFISVFIIIRLFLFIFWLLLWYFYLCNCDVYVIIWYFFLSRLLLSFNIGLWLIRLLLLLIVCIGLGIV